MPEKQPMITQPMIEQYLTFLREEERSKATIQMSNSANSSTSIGTESSGVEVITWI